MKNGLPWAGGLWLALWLVMAPAAAQTPSPENTAAAKELVATINIAAQFKALLPSLFSTMKPAIVQGRADVARDYDALIPLLTEGFQKRLGELSDAIAVVYASNFSADELRALSAFYKTPVGQKLLQKSPLVAQQTMAIGQQFGRSVGEELRQQITDELKKRGHSI